MFSLVSYNTASLASVVIFLTNFKRQAFLLIELIETHKLQFGVQ